MASSAYSKFNNNTNQESPAPQPMYISGDNNANGGEENFIFEYLWVSDVDKEILKSESSFGIYKSN